MICVGNVKALVQYGGRHIVFNIDFNATYWLSDTSLPLGDPRGREVRVPRALGREL